jgi:hypothetical protein
MVGGALLVLTLAACSGGSDPADGPDDPGGPDVPSSPLTTPSAGDPPTDGGTTSGVYASREAWICRPDLRTDPCRDLDVTRLDPSGDRTVEQRSPAADPPVDCFYVYPTVSADEGLNSDREVGPDDAEVQTVVAQAAQYARSCRVFAPVYRQVTVAALFGGRFGEGGETAYADVLDAWRTYVADFSDGRGVIVVGHSQGASILRRLVAEEIDPDPELRQRLVAAHLLGTSVQVPDGELVGGSFAEVPGCTEAEQTGCVVSWSSYPADAPPPPDALFGRSEGEGTRALCTDVVALLGRERGSAIAPASGTLGTLEGVREVDTRFVSLPEVVEVSCAAEGDLDYLAVDLAQADDPRPVDALETQALGPAWGLHTLDLSLAQDDLVELARRQGEAYAR